MFLHMFSNMFLQHFVSFFKNVNRQKLILSQLDRKVTVYTFSQRYNAKR